MTNCTKYLLLICTALLAFSCNEAEKKVTEYSNCIHSFEFRIPETPNPLGFVSRIKVEDPKLDSLLRNFGKTWPKIIFQNQIFDDSICRYTILKVNYDTLQYFDIGAWVNLNDLHFLKSQKGCDSLSLKTFNQLKIIIQKDTMKWILNQCISNSVL